MADTSTLVDRVKIFIESRGTGPFVLGNAVPAFRGVEALADGLTYSYAVESGSDYEAGQGVFVEAVNQLLRTPVISSNGNAPVDFPENATIAFTALASDLAAAREGTGTVTRVDASGGMTGMEFSGVPIEGAGTMTLGGVLLPEHGGTGATSIGGIKDAIGLGNVDNTSDADKPISTATQSALDEVLNALTERVVSVESIPDLQAMPPSETAVYSVVSYHPRGDSGGGLFRWDPARSKSEHNGGTLIDPDRAWPEWDNQSQVNAWFSPSASPETGVFVRVFSSVLSDLNFGAAEIDRNLNHQDMMIAMLKASAGLSLSLMTSPWRISNTHILGEEQKGTSVTGVVQADGFFTRIIRSGTADLWRSCFHITTSGTFFDKLYLYAEDGFDERGGLTYAAPAGENTIGDLQGAYWRLGVAYPKDTGPEFRLNARSLVAYHSGRSYSSSTPNTPPGNIQIERVGGFYTGFVDISGGSVEISSLSLRGAFASQAIKKGSEAVGGVIRVGRLTYTDGLADARLTCASTPSLEGALPGAIFTGQTSGATGAMVGVARDRIDLKDVSGTFEVGETVSSTDGHSLVVATATAYSATSVVMDDGVIGNGGVHFDLFQINSVYIDGAAGDVLSILNNGLVNIGSITAKNLRSCRNILRWTPDTSGSDPSRESRLTIGSFVLENATMQTPSAYTPIFIGPGGRASFERIDWTHITAGSRTNFFAWQSPIDIGSMRINTSGGNYSRFLNSAAPGYSALSKVFIAFDSANRVGACSSGTLIITDGRYPNGVAAFDGAGTVVATNFSAS